MTPALYILTGAMAAGKTTVAGLLARRFQTSVHVEGDAFLRMIVRGAADMGPVLGPEALAQLRLRQDLAADAVRRFLAAGFTTVYEDILAGPHLARMTAELAAFHPRVVVLAPDAATLAQRDRARGKAGYRDDFPPEVLVRAFEEDTSRIGLRIDTSAMDAEEVVERILSSW